MGHWVVVEEHPWKDDTVNWRWYLGPQLMAIVPISRMVLEELFGRPDVATVDDRPMKFIWELYLVAAGENKEYALEWGRKNEGIRPVHLFIRKVTDDPDPNMLFPGGLTYRELMRLRDQASTN